MTILVVAKSNHIIFRLTDSGVLVLLGCPVPSNLRARSQLPTVGGCRTLELLSLNGCTQITDIAMMSFGGPSYFGGKGSGQQIARLDLSRCDIRVSGMHWFVSKTEMNYRSQYYY